MGRKKSANYTSEQLQNAVKSVKNQEMTCTEAARFHDVPFSTLYSNVRKFGFETNCNCILLIHVLFDFFVRCEKQYLTKE